MVTSQEVFAYVKNMARSGDFYWVFAHVTPSLDRAWVRPASTLRETAIATPTAMGPRRGWARGTRTT